MIQFVTCACTRGATYDYLNQQVAASSNATTLRKYQTQIKAKIYLLNKAIGGVHSSKFTFAKRRQFLRLRNKFNKLYLKTIRKISRAQIRKTGAGRNTYKPSYQITSMRSRNNPMRKQITDLLKSVNTGLAQCRKLAPTKRIPTELNNVLASLKTLAALINAYAWTRTGRGSRETIGFKKDFKKHVAEHARCIKLQPAPKTQKQLTKDANLKKLKDAADKAEKEYWKERNKYGKFVEGAGDLARKFG